MEGELGMLRWNMHPTYAHEEASLTWGCNLEYQPCAPW